MLLKRYDKTSRFLREYGIVLYSHFPVSSAVSLTVNDLVCGCLCVHSAYVQTQKNVELETKVRGLHVVIEDLKEKSKASVSKSVSKKFTCQNMHDVFVYARCACDIEGGTK